MGDLIAQRLGKDVAGKIHRYVHNIKWKFVNRQYHLLAESNSEFLYLWLRGTFGTAGFWFNYRSARNGYCSAAISRWMKPRYTADLPATYWYSSAKSQK